MMSKEQLASARILIVDDDRGTLEMCEATLRASGYRSIKTASDPRGVLALFVEYDPDILVLDVVMPHLSGLELLELLHRSAPEVDSLPIIVTTAFPSPEVRHKALMAGAVEILEKPFDCHEFSMRVGNLLRLRLATRESQAQNEALFRELLDRSEELSNYQDELKEAQLEVIARLARAGEQHDDNTGRHTQRVAITAGLLAHGLGLSAGAVEVIQKAAPLHDVGKIGVSDSILLKPGKLTVGEFRVMQKHCRMGSELLSGGRSEVVQMAESIALTHHERWNGQGYPNELKGEEIPIEGRILSVADVFDALTHERPYKAAWSVEDALEELRRQSGHQFDPRIVECFLLLPHHKIV
jgi:putative two-component system response regulator